MELQEAIKKRTSTRKFLNKKLELNKIIRAIQNVRFSPCAGNMYDLRFIIIQKEETITKIAEASQQDFVRQAPAAIAIVSDREKVKKMYDYNDKGFASQQAGAAIQTILLSLTENDISSCWIGFFDDRLMNDALGVKGKTVEAVIAIGAGTKNKGEKAGKKAKPELENIIFFEKYGKSKLEPETRIRSDWA
jgi:nitroreductase